MASLTRRRFFAVAAVAVVAIWQANLPRTAAQLSSSDFVWSVLPVADAFSFRAVRVASRPSSSSSSSSMGNFPRRRQRPDGARPVPSKSTLHSTAQGDNTNTADEDGPVAAETTTVAASSVLLKVWFHIVALLVVASYLPASSLYHNGDPSSSPWSAATTLHMARTAADSVFFALPTRGWRLVHGLSAMVFGGTIIATTVMEWRLTATTTAATTAATTATTSIMPTPTTSDGSGIPDDDGTETHTAATAAATATAITTLFGTEKALVLPAVSLSLLSGAAQAVHMYGSLRTAPFYVKASLYVLTAFGLWWAVTDRPTQRQVVSAVVVVTKEAAVAAAVDEGGEGASDAAVDNNNNDDALAAVGRRRLYGNVVSCLFVVALYTIMIIKPSRLWWW